MLAPSKTKKGPMRLFASPRPIRSPLAAFLASWPSGPKQTVFPRLSTIEIQETVSSRLSNHQDPTDGYYFARHIICERKLQYSGKPFPFGKFGSTRDRGRRLVDRPDADII